MNDLSLTNPFRSLIAALEKRDEYTAGHDQRTKLIALDIGEQCNLEAEELAILEIAASVHDTPTANAARISLFSHVS